MLPPHTTPFTQKTMMNRHGPDDLPRSKKRVLKACTAARHFANHYTDASRARLAFFLQKAKGNPDMRRQLCDFLTRRNNVSARA